MVLSSSLAIIMLLSLVSVSIAITPSGIVHVEMIVQLNEGLNEIPLPVQPIVPSIIVNESGKILIPVYQNGTLYVYAPSPGLAVISYVANVSTYGNALQFAIRANYTYKIAISNNIVLLTLLKNVSKVYYENGKLVVVAYGPQIVQYVVKKVSYTSTTTIRSTVATSSTVATGRTSTVLTTSTLRTTTTVVTSIASSTTPLHTRTTYSTVSSTRTSIASITKSISASKPAVTTSSTTSSATGTVSSLHHASTSTPSGRASQALPSYALIGIGVAIAVAIGIGVGLGLRRRGSTAAVLSSELSPLDKDIINAIEQNGGSILQSELQKRLGVPKTTLWRHIKKLERLGIVKIVKEGGYNKIVLERKP